MRQKKDRWMVLEWDLLLASSFPWLPDSSSPERKPLADLGSLDFFSLFPYCLPLPPRRRME